MADTGQVEYSIVGTPLDSGPAHEPKYIWTVSTLVTWEEWHTLGAIFSKCDRLRRASGSYRILVEDSVQEVIEYGPRTRGLASGGTETTGVWGVAYPAQFYARMLEPKSQYLTNGVYPYIASFTLRELDKVLA